MLKQAGTGRRRGADDRHEPPSVIRYITRRGGTRVQSTRLPLSQGRCTMGNSGKGVSTMQSPSDRRSTKTWANAAIRFLGTITAIYRQAPRRIQALRCIRISYGSEESGHQKLTF